MEAHSRNDFRSRLCGIKLTKEKPPGNRKMSRESRLLIYPIRLFFPCHWHSHFTYKAHIFTGRFIEMLSWRNASFYLSFPSFLIFFISKSKNIRRSFRTLMVVAIALNGGLLWYSILTTWNERCPLPDLRRLTGHVWLRLSRVIYSFLIKLGCKGRPV